MTVAAANANEQLVLDFFEVLSSGDLEKLRGFYHEHSVWEPKVKDIAAATNYVRAALDAGLAGKPIAVAQTQPYGCDVKY